MLVYTRAKKIYFLVLPHVLRLHILTFVSSNQHNHAFFSSLTTCTYIFSTFNQVLCKAKTKSDERCWMWRNTFTQHTFYIFLVFSYVLLLFLHHFSKFSSLCSCLFHSFRKLSELWTFFQISSYSYIFVRAIHHQSRSRDDEKHFAIKIRQLFPAEEIFGLGKDGEGMRVSSKDMWIVLRISLFAWEFKSCTLKGEKSEKLLSRVASNLN